MQNLLTHLYVLAAHVGHARVRQLLVATGLLSGTVLAAVVLWFTVSTRQAAIDDVLREMHNDALLLAEDQDRLLLAADGVQRGLIETMRGIGAYSADTYAQIARTGAIQQDLHHRIAGLPYVAALLLFDRHGALLNLSGELPPPPISDQDRDFTRDVQAAGAPDLFISAPSRDRSSGRWHFYLSRRFDAADGQSLGYVVSTIDIDYFERFFARLPLTGGGGYALYRRDGMLLARYPAADTLVGKNYAATPNFARMVAALDGGVARQNGRFDGKDRLIVPRTMPHFPLIISVSDTMETVLAPWRTHANILVGTTVLLELGMIAGVLLLLGHLRNEERLRAAEKAQTQAEERERAAGALHTQQQRFDTAAQNMQQGLLMVGNDGNILVANRRFHELWGLPIDRIVPGTPYDQLVGHVRGNVSQHDLEVIHNRRTEMIARNVRSSFMWELSDGRTIAITHHPMEDGWLATYEDVTERRAAEAKIAHLAQYDALTDLPNRVLFRDALEHALSYSRRGHLLALHCLDLDQFKAVNDTLGHPIGDRLLQAVAVRLRKGVRDTDTVARLGGDEFAIVQSSIDAPHEATMLANRLIEMVSAPYEIDGHQIVVGVSIGIAYAPMDGTDADVLLKDADLALYRSKLDGRGMYRLFHSAMDTEMQARRLLELDLRQALPLGQLELLYQPLIDLNTQAAGGFEALLRWSHPDRGMIPPDRFIPLAEEIGVIVPIGEWVLRQACLAATSWPDHLRVSVNLSPAQFKSRDLVGAVAGALRDSGLDSDRLELEITETVMLHDTATTLATLHGLRKLGVRIAMDDFGTGYSSLSYLRRFPFDRLKIDQSFVRELGRQRDCDAIVRAVIALGRDLGMATTAEGVETPEQLRTLAQAGCSDIQGYLFSRPIRLHEIPDMLRSMPTASSLLREPAPEQAAAAD